MKRIRYSYIQGENAKNIKLLRQQNKILIHCPSNELMIMNKNTILKEGTSGDKSLGIKRLDFAITVRFSITIHVE